MCGMFAGFLLTAAGAVLALIYLAFVIARYQPVLAIVLFPFSGVAAVTILAASGVVWPLPMNLFDTCGGPHDPSNLLHYFLST